MFAVNAAFEALTFPLGTGLIHNDAHAGSLLADSRSPSGYVLGDWESACDGLREIDVVPDGAPGNRFGLPEQQRREFSDAYGYDLASWPGWPVMRDVRDRTRSPVISVLGAAGARIPLPLAALIQAGTRTLSGARHEHAG
jgi:hypothetical protein